MDLCSHFHEPFLVGILPVDAHLYFTAGENVVIVGERLDGNNRTPHFLGPQILNACYSKNCVELSTALYLSISSVCIRT